MYFHPIFCLFENFLRKKFKLYGLRIRCSPSSSFSYIANKLKIIFIKEKRGAYTFFFLLGFVGKRVKMKKENGKKET
jgi:hypothetical protein